MKAVFYNYFNKNKYKLLVYGAAVFLSGLGRFSNASGIFIWFFVGGFDFHDSEFELTLPLSLKDRLLGHLLFSSFLILISLAWILLMNFIRPFLGMDDLIYSIIIVLLMPIALGRKFFKVGDLITIFTVLSFIITLFWIDLSSMNSLYKLGLAVLVSFGLYGLNAFDFYKKKKEYYYVEG